MVRTILTLAELAKQRYAKCLPSKASRNLAKSLPPLAVGDPDFPETMRTLEISRLDARGCIMSVNYGKFYCRKGGYFVPIVATNASEQIDGARLADYDAETRTVTVCVDCSEVRDFWLRIVIPLQKIEALDSVLEATGRVSTVKYSPRGAYSIVSNSCQRIDGARLVSYDENTRMLVMRVTHSKIPQFWLEITLSLEKLEEWIGRVAPEEEEAQEPVVKRAKVADCC